MYMSFPGHCSIPVLTQDLLYTENCTIYNLHYLILISLAPSVTATVDISGSRVIGGSVTLTCDVTGLSSLASDTAIVVSGPRGVMGSGASTLQVTLNPAEISDAGQYTCVATVSSSLLNGGSVMDTDTEDLTLQSEHTAL